jgi:GxxExxY protein
MAEFTGLHADLTRKIIGAARRVHRTLGTGFLEKVYENSLALELTDAGLIVAQSAPIEVRYRGQVVGVYEADILVNDLVVLELKAVEQLVTPHEVQLVNYLRATRIEVGLLINFGARLDICRRILTNDRKGFFDPPPVERL